MPARPRPAALLALLPLVLAGCGEGPAATAPRTPDPSASVRSEQPSGTPSPRASTAPVSTDTVLRFEVRLAGSYAQGEPSDHRSRILSMLGGASERYELLLGRGNGPSAPPVLELAPKIPVGDRAPLLAGQNELRERLSALGEVTASPYRAAHLVVLGEAAGGSPAQADFRDSSARVAEAVGVRGWSSSRSTTPEGTRYVYLIEVSLTPEQAARARAAVARETGLAPTEVLVELF